MACSVVDGLGLIIVIIVNIVVTRLSISRRRSSATCHGWMRMGWQQVQTSGYDFGYLIKILTCQTLPADEQGFFELLALYFPTLYDVKLLMTHVDGLHGGLQRVAEDLKVERIGPMHQAGSDSMLTNATFFRLAELAFSSPEKVEEKYRGAIYGLGEHAYRGKQHQDAAASKYNQDNGGTMNGGH